MANKKRVLKQKKQVNEDMTQIRNLIILLVIVILICVGIYFLTEKLVDKDLIKKSDTSTATAEIDYDSAIVGTMFNRVEDEYYVILYSKEDDGMKYDTLLNIYRSSENYIKTYYVNLDLKINNGALKDTLNKTPKNSKEVSVTGPTLYKIKDGKVTECYSDFDSIKSILK